MVVFVTIRTEQVFKKPDTLSLELTGPFQRTGMPDLKLEVARLHYLC